MLWLTWRQWRSQAVVTYTAIAAVCIVLAATGSQLASIPSSSAADYLHKVQGNQLDTTLYAVTLLALIAFPAVVGAICGAPLVARELDNGTQRLVWNQSISRTRWLLIKLCVTGAGTVAAAGLFSLAVTWWADPIDHAADQATTSAAPVGFLFPRLSPIVFGARGVVPVAFAAFAFVLGVGIGVLTRRVLTSIGVAIVACAVVEVIQALMVRPALFASDRMTVTVTAGNLLNTSTVNIHAPGAWIVSTRIVDASGQPAPGVTLDNWMKCLPGPGQTDTNCFTALAARGYRAQVSYQPASRFWDIQWAETTIFVTLAVAVTAACVWWLRRRLS